MIKLPPDAIQFIRLQRTEYASKPVHEVEEGFAKDVEQFAERLVPFLPRPKPQMRFVDIGCGVGFGLLGLLSIYGPEHNFVGIDRGASSAKVSYGFSEKPSAYNSLRLTREILVAAGVSADQIACIDIDCEPFPLGFADIVSSTYAWGFHFPVQAYLQEVDSILAPDGVVIIDVRQGLGQELALKERFEVVHSFPGPAGKSERLILKPRRTET